MASTLNDTRVTGTTATVERTEASEYLRIARFCALEEILGLVPQRARAPEHGGGGRRRRERPRGTA